MYNGRMEETSNSNMFTKASLRSTSTQHVEMLAPRYEGAKAMREAQVFMYNAQRKICCMHGCCSRMFAATRDAKASRLNHGTPRPAGTTR